MLTDARFLHLAVFLPTVSMPAAVGREPDVKLLENGAVTEKRDRGSIPVREVVGGVLTDFAQSHQFSSTSRVQLCHLALLAFVVDSYPTWNIFCQQALRGTAYSTVSVHAPRSRNSLTIRVYLTSTNLTNPAWL